MPGHRVHKLTAICSDESIGEVFSSCPSTSIAELFVDRSVVLLGKMPSCPLLFVLRIFGHLQSDCSFLSYLAGTTGSLKTLEIVHFTVPPPNQAVTAIVAVSPLLEIVKFGMHEPDYMKLNSMDKNGDVFEEETRGYGFIHEVDRNEYLVKLVKSLHGCVYLSNVKLCLFSSVQPGRCQTTWNRDGKSEVRDACVPFRHCPIHWSINDEVYLPVGRSAKHWVWSC